METDEIEKMKRIKKLTDMCLRTLKPAEDTSGVYTAEIRVFDYFELASVVRNLMKLCILAVDADSAELPSTVESQSIDIGLILGVALQLFPVDEIELINEMCYLYPITNQKVANENTDGLKDNIDQEST